MSDSLWPHGLYSPWNSLGQNTEWGAFPFSWGIFPTQGSNPGLLHYRWNLYQLSHQGSPRILEWVAYPFSSGSSWPRNQTGVSCIADGFFTNWAIREARRNIARLFIPSCCCSFAQLCPTFYDPVDCSTLGLPVLHHLQEFAQTHVHWVGEAIQSHPVSPPSPPVLNLSQDENSFQWGQLFALSDQSIGASTIIYSRYTLHGLTIFS